MAQMIRKLLSDIADLKLSVEQKRETYQELKKNDPDASNELDDIITDLKEIENELGAFYQNLADDFLEDALENWE